MKPYYLFFLCIIATLSLKAQENAQFEKIAEATMNPGEINIAVGDDFNTISLDNQSVKLTHEKLKHFEIEKLSENAFVAGFHMTDKKIEVKNIQLKEASLLFDYEFKNITIPGVTFSGKISFLDKEMAKNFNIDEKLLYKHILPVIHDYLFKMKGDNPCLEQARKACSEIKSLSLSMFLKECAFTCN